MHNKEPTYQKEKGFTLMFQSGFGSNMRRLYNVVSNTATKSEILKPEVSFMIQNIINVH